MPVTCSSFLYGLFSVSRQRVLTLTWTSPDDSRGGARGSWRCPFRHGSEEGGATCSGGHSH
jgi:hypothetical protein